MMPSRGLPLARGTAPRLYQLQCRHLSSASRRIPPAPLRHALRSPLRTTQWQTSLPALPVPSLGIRHASSTPQQTAQPAPPLASPPPESASAATSPSPPVSELPSFPNLDTISLDASELTPIADIPEQIGYLHQIGLNYGFGPTSMLEWMIEHIHILGGLPWWGSIAATAVILRLAIFPLYLKSSDVMARTTALVSITKPITEKMQAAQRAGDQETMMMAWQELVAVRKRAGVGYRHQFAPMIVQGIFAYCGFKLIRAMVHLPVPALKTEGPLWLHDLTLTDPYLILPLAMAGCVHLLVRMGGESGAQAPSQLGAGMQRFMLWGMPGIIVMAMGYQSAALCVWFAAGGTMGIAQSLLLQQPRVREFFGIAPLYRPTKEESDKGPMGALLESLTSRRKFSPEAATTNTRRPSPAAGKNAAFMNPTYQSPNLRRSTANRPFRKKGEIIDVEPVIKPRQTPPSDPEMIQPHHQPHQSVLGKAASSWHDWKKWWRDRVRRENEEQIEEKKRKLFRKEAEAYEKRAQRRKGGGGGGS